MRKKLIFISMLIFSLNLAGCGSKKAINNPTDSFETTVDDSFVEKEIEGDFSITSENGSEVVENNGIYTITKGDVYNLTGVLLEGQLIIDAGDEAVELILNNVSITSNKGAAICVTSAGKMKIKSEENTYNVVEDTRAVKNDNDDSDGGNAAIFSNVDLSFTGKGTLVVNASYNNGIQSKKDVSFKNTTMKIKAVNNAIKGKDSVTIESGNFTLISTAGDGIKTVDSDVSEKGKQRGIVSILDGNINIYSACDGIDAAYNVEISGDTVLNIFTDTYSEYSEDVTSTERDFFLILDNYSEDYDYYVYYYNDNDSDGRYVKGSFYSTVRGGSGMYYALSFDEPASAKNMIIYQFKAGANVEKDKCIASSSGDVVNSSMNGFLISSMNNGEISGDFVSLSTGSSGGKSDKSIYSSKGIKAVNEIVIDGGDIIIKANDDGIHTDQDIIINGGKITIVEAYEGLEANQVVINGGEHYIYAKDDAINACAGNKTPLIKVTGGVLTVKTPSGDTDAIDSNGSYEQTGGKVLVQGGATMGSVAGSVDVDGEITITGGIIVALGGICETPTNSVNAYASSGSSFSAGDYEVVCDGKTIFTFTLTEGYSSIWVCSDELTTGTECKITKSGSEVLSWTQEAGTMGAAGGFGGFGGGPGGFGGGPGGQGRH